MLVKYDNLLMNKSILPDKFSYNHSKYRGICNKINTEVYLVRIV